MKKYYALKDPTVSAMEKRHSEISRKLAGECMVILENNGVLPLQASCNAVALYGMGARHTVKGGTGSGDVNCRCSVSVEEGLRTAGLEIRSDAWLEECDKTFENARYAYEKSLLQIAKEQNISLIAAELSNPFYRPCEPLIRKEHLTDDCEYAIYVIARDSGEGSDRKCEPGDYYLYDTEEKNIHTLTKAYKHVIVLLNVGGIIDTSFLKKEHNISAIVLIGQTGSQGGYAVSDVLTGKTMPSGKLTDTWARKYSDYPGDKSFIYQNDNVDDAYYTEGEYVGYRFFEKNHLEPAYCFGYGKGYTEFQVNVLSHHETKHAMEIRVKVKNTGDRYPGKEVVQIYYSHIGDSDCRQLAAFAKTKMLLPGQEEIMTVSVPFCQLRSFDQTERQWILKKGKYDIMVGTSWSTISETYAISMDEDIVYSSGCKTAKARPLYQDHRKEVLVFDDVRKGTETENGGDR